MAQYPDYRIDDSWITSQRGPGNPVDPYKPYAFLTERELISRGVVEDVNTVFLTNHECPYRCLMCDLWKNTTQDPVPPGAIPAQIQYALSRLPAAKHIKLYNSGSFFDRRAIPTEDHRAIADLLEPFETVIVESHPAFIGRQAVTFSRMLRGKLQVAIGLETVHPQVLPLLNKKMTLNRFDEAVQFLRSHHIGVRSFILLRPPFLSEAESILWARKSIDHAFRAGTDICIVIPVRPGNGALDTLARQGFFKTPGIESLEEVLEYGIGLKKGFVFADLWDLELFSSCDLCFKVRKKRLQQMNLTQEIPPPVSCSCHN